MNELDYRAYWEAGLTWGRYLEEEVRAHRSLWEGVYRKTVVPAWARERVTPLAGPLRLLVLTEDWCGDASNTVPVLARLAEAAPELEVRLLKRDENPELMDRHLTNGARSIPLAIVLDEEFHPGGSWGPRPAELQAWILGEKRKAERPAEEIYRDARAWYARDRGETTVREVIEAIETAAGAVRSPS